MSKNYGENMSSQIRIWQIIKEALQLYKNNFNLFILYPMYSFLIEYISVMLNFVGDIVSREHDIFISLLVFPIMLVSIYFVSRIDVAFFISITEKYNNSITNFKDSYSKAKSKTWGYIGISIVLGIMLLIPIVIGTLSFLFINNVIVKWTLTLISAIAWAYISSVYGYAPLFKVLTDRIYYFDASKELVKGHLLKVFILNVMLGSIFSLPYILYRHVYGAMYTLSPLNNFVITTLNGIVLIFIIPFIKSVSIILYHKLENKQ
ncbi:hypothetical protein [Alkaliphilus peptidifermentans]|uniref:Membrane domain of glycerophosphoryl diester phosphodiesterase n=1 Tax=Alkaliphilus peptidifermentans DSM 18978 TaxID=1120976 RepID=A0A1G5L143_9FIRM|nr:hypothetical protein [Alkaliphilus peptidifermentans]SCZ05919.1 hypothetical protein SAMN03080606_03912 [Alkaliphilus peptidifermentans DSM 18978]